ncbi:hypothetical protein [Corynebacterium cystitidis]|uniref:Lipoprotein n=1 Tax=Corynebacterium cystitidis DSM 20524 TaxID=1121357 RepID=A0A1H9T4F6_9CORY|nr:hypothetical protein [Corynebacterium cystitidis]WJY83435.1 hypothetical protein CCYS_12750 [Corynebacterium cystitidis DSM 20524]SER91463.1 hypothetical protein SAMN05661109_01292 [Corynebacterium cystitidis DSM 20524]SNV61601.1 Uncharacterised protein [Corynebacterium cystitidis]
MATSSSRRRLVRFIFLSGVLSILVAGCTSASETPEVTQSSTSSVEISGLDGLDGNIDVPPASDADYAATIVAFAQRVSDHWPHASKVWPGADYTEHVAVVFRLNNEGSVVTAWAVDFQGSHELQPEETKQLIAPPPGGYSPGEFNGRTAVFLSIDDLNRAKDPDGEELYRFASHELVHFYHQPDLDQRGEESDGRSQDYPIDPEPRVMRRMIYHNLLSAYENPDRAQEHLEHAKFWQEKWQQTYPAEYQGVRHSDLVEGHARYVEYLLTFYRPDLSPEQFRQRAIQVLNKDQVFSAADMEGYEINYLAGLLLDSLQPAWKDDALRNQTPFIETLLQPFNAKEQELDSQLDEQVNKDIEEINSGIAESIKPLEAAEKDTSIPYLVIDKSASESSFGAEHFISIDGKEVATTFVASYQTDGGQLVILGAPVYMRGDQITVPLPKDTTDQDGRLDIDSDSVIATNIEVDKTNDPDGRILYLVKVVN